MTKLLKILAALVTVMVLAACPTESSPESSSFGDNLNLSGQLYTREIKSDTTTIFASGQLVTYNALGTDIQAEISDGGLGGTGEVKNGQFNFSIGKPVVSALSSLDAGDANLAVISEFYPDINISSPGVKAAFLTLIIEDNPEYTLLTRELTKTSIPSPGLDLNFTLKMNLVSEAVSYVYVDDDVSITAEGGSAPPINGEEYDLSGITLNLTTKKIDLNLKKGWNAINTSLTAVLKPSTDFSEVEVDGVLGISLGNPSSLNWVLNSSEAANGPLPFNFSWLP